MAIQTGDVTISNLSLLGKRAAGGGRYRNTATLSVASGDIYGTDHRIPVDKAALGCPTAIESFEFLNDGAAGYKYHYHKDNEDILLYVPRLLAGATTIDVGLATTTDAIRMLGAARQYTGVALIITQDSGGGNAINQSYQMPTFIELTSGDIMVAITLDVAYVGY